MKGDVRTPADPEDFETTLSRGPAPPLDLQIRVAPDGQYVAFITEPELPQGRHPAASYRVLYVAPGLAVKSGMTGRMLEAVGDLCEVAATIEGRFDGGRLKVPLTGFAGKPGWFAVVTVSRIGLTSAPAGLARSPAGSG